MMREPSRREFVQSAFAVSKRETENLHAAGRSATMLRRSRGKGVTRFFDYGVSRAPNLHLSCYLTLTLAAVCLGFAEMFFLPWMPWFLSALLVLIGLAWK